MSKERIRLVHLVWAPLGPEPLAGFLEAYRRFDAGTGHGLVILLNGFAAGQDLSPWRSLLAGIEHEEVRLDAPVSDLAAYWQAARRVSAERYCFANSYSLPLTDGWLSALDGVLASPGVGLVGASGSWGSIRSYQRFMLGLGGPYAEVFDDRRATAARLAAVAAEQPSAPPPKQRRQPIRFARTLLEQSYGFTTFPSRHLRTNAFMLSAEVLSRLRLPAPARKADAYRLESGRSSITSQVEGLGLSVRVVGRDGRGYAPSDWPESATFWQRDQGNLLVSDNQTRGYDRADPDTRSTLARFAWGSRADPGAQGPLVA